MVSEDIQPPEATSTTPKFPLRKLSIELLRLTKEDIIAARGYPMRNMSSGYNQPKWHDLYFREMKTFESYLENNDWFTLLPNCPTKKSATTLLPTNIGGLNKIFTNLTGSMIESEICSIKKGGRNVSVFLKRLPYSRIPKSLDAPLDEPISQSKCKPCVKQPLWYDLYFYEMLRYEKKKKEEKLTEQKMNEEASKLVPERSL